MASKGAQLKAEWMKMPDEWFEPMTFGELEVGEKFITLPRPSDYGGHGGSRNGVFHCIFRKSRNGWAEKTWGGALEIFPNDQYVIRVV